MKYRILTKYIIFVIISWQNSVVLNITNEAPDTIGPELQQTFMKHDVKIILFTFLFKRGSSLLAEIWKLHFVKHAVLG